MASLGCGENPLEFKGGCHGNDGAVPAESADGALEVVERDGVRCEAAKDPVIEFALAFAAGSDCVVCRRSHSHPMIVIISAGPSVFLIL
jgi:hypothetical protein